LEFELNRILDKAVGLGVQYADARYERQNDELVWVENKTLKNYSSSIPASYLFIIGKK